jgi:hypothetical protein
MKKFLVLIIFSLLFWNCNKKTKEKKTNDDKIRGSISGSKDSLYKNTDLFDEVFILGLKNFKDSLIFKKGFLIYKADTIFFQKNLPLNEKSVLIGKTKGYKFMLFLTRINFTNLKYNFKVLNGQNIEIENKSGIAVLSSSFFFALEVDEDDKSGNSYGSNEYFDKKNDCFFSIRLGIENDENNKIRAKVIYECIQESKKTIKLNECPVLRSF